MAAGLKYRQNDREWYLIADRKNMKRVRGMNIRGYHRTSIKMIKKQTPANRRTAVTRCSASSLDHELSLFMLATIMSFGF